jgi:hypothetical protein
MKTLLTAIIFTLSLAPHAYGFSDTRPIVDLLDNGSLSGHNYIACDKEDKEVQHGKTVITNRV